MSTENATHMLFEIARSQDALMHQTSAELGVKTALYLVFTAFVFNAAFQVGLFARGLASVWAERAVLTSFMAAAVALIGGVALLIGAFVRTYHILPIGALRQYAQDAADYRRNYPDAPGGDAAEGILTTMEEAVDANIRVNETKAFSITIGASALLISVLVVAIAGLFAVIAFLEAIRLS